jgi:hypothetical protein
MSAARRRQPANRRRGRAGKGRPGADDLWRAVPRLPDPEPIVPVPDPTALIRSLGEPPLPGQGALAGHVLNAVVERAAGLATALAATADLLAEPQTDD